MNNKTYKLTSDGGKIAAALVKMCQPNQPGETLIRNGLNQSSFGLFLAKIAEAHFAKGRSPEQVADVFAMLSGTNASAANKALMEATLEFEGEKPQSVSAFWGKAGTTKGAPNLALLDV